MLSFYRERVGGERFLLNYAYIACHALRDRKNQRYADYADASRKGGEHRPAFFREKVFKGEHEGGSKGHGGLLFALFAARLYALGFICRRFGFYLGF